ncbi:hypothetical protein PENTCL1PPCAC_14389, partial [Pristionchus entomophagus]
MFYVSCFSVPFALMNIHFLYRYWTASKPHLIYLFSSIPFIIFLTTIAVGVFIMCAVALRGNLPTNGTELLRSELEKQVSRKVNVSHQWILMDWNDDAGIVRLVLSTFALDLIMMVALLLTIVLATLTLAGIRRAMMMSKAKGNMQLRLFISVSAQTFVPFICVYIPYACCINFPPAGIPTGLIAELCFIFTSCFPAWDAVIVIMLIGDYRHACFRMVSRFKPPTISTATNMTVAPTHMQSMAVERSVAVVTSAGVFTNLLLLYCIRRHTRMLLGAYKQLLSIFATFDLCLTVIHGIVHPVRFASAQSKCSRLLKLLVVDAVFGIASNSGFNDNSQRIVSFYCSLFSTPFALMNIQLLFRFWTVSKPDLVPLFSSVPFIIVITLIPLGVLTVWYHLCVFGLSGDVQNAATELMRSELENRGGANVSQGWIIMDWSDESEVPRLSYILFAFDIIMACSFILAITLGFATLAGIRRAKLASASKGNLQLRLLISVIAQTFVPVLCVYIPYTCVLNFTPLRIPVEMMAYLIFLLTACFPAWDAVIVILLIGDYRHACLRLFVPYKP